MACSSREVVEYRYAPPRSRLSGSIGQESNGQGSGPPKRRGVGEIPTGRPGRQSKSLTPEQVDGVLIKTAPNRLHNYIVVSLLTGGRTEELRALRWDHVHLDAAPPHIEVWRSVRADGDTKTRRSRRTLALPARCVDALKKQRAQQLADRLSAGDRWQENGLVFATSVGTKMLAGNVRRDFRRALALVPGIDPSMWTHASCVIRSFRCCPTRECP